VRAGLLRADYAAGNLHRRPESALMNRYWAFLCLFIAIGAVVVVGLEMCGIQPSTPEATGRDE
jgi:hypothetical protein